MSTKTSAKSRGKKGTKNTRQPHTAREGGKKIKSRNKCWSCFWCRCCCCSDRGCFPQYQLIASYEQHFFRIGNGRSKRIIYNKIKNVIFSIKIFTLRFDAPHVFFHSHFPLALGVCVCVLCKEIFVRLNTLEHFGSRSVCLWNGFLMFLFIYFVCFHW